MRTFKGFSTIDQTWGNFKLYDIDLAKRDLLNEFYTRKGERLMSPQFGCIVWDLLFDPMTEETIELLREDCQRIVSKDPRLELKEFDVKEDFDNQTITIAILLNYIPTTTLTELIAVFQRQIETNKLQG